MSPSLIFTILSRARKNVNFLLKAHFKKSSEDALTSFKNNGTLTQKS